MCGSGSAGSEPELRNRDQDLRRSSARSALTAVRGTVFLSEWEWDLGGILLVQDQRLSRALRALFSARELSTNENANRETGHEYEHFRHVFLL